MCQSQADGGRRCYAHQRQRVDKLERQLEQSPPDSPEREQLSSRLEDAQAALIQTRTGLQQHIAERTAGGPYDADQLTASINRYVADSPSGKPILLPGGTFRVTHAHTSHGHTVLEVAGPTSARSYSRSVAQRYARDAAGKQVTRVSAAELQQDFDTMLVTADGRAGAAVRSSGEIAAVYSTSTTSRGVTQALLPIAVDKGGTHLECFNTFLPKIYARSGFVAVASIPFDREFAPEGWNYQSMKDLAPPRGEPDIIFMASAQHHAKLGHPEHRIFQTYDEADEYTRKGLSA